MHANSPTQEYIIADGDDMHFSVDCGSGADDVVQMRGWGFRPLLPPRLTRRLQKLRGQFARAESHGERQEAAAARRQAHVASLACKAQEESDKLEQARSRRAVASGSDKVFSIQEKDDKVSFAEPGWGISRPLPPRLSQRLQTLRKRFAYDPEENTTGIVMELMQVSHPLRTRRALTCGACLACRVALP